MEGRVDFVSSDTYPLCSFVSLSTNLGFLFSQRRLQTKSSYANKQKMRWFWHLTDHQQHGGYETKHASHFPDPEIQQHRVGTDDNHAIALTLHHHTKHWNTKRTAQNCSVFLLMGGWERKANVVYSCWGSKVPRWSGTWGDLAHNLFTLRIHPFPMSTTIISTTLSLRVTRSSQPQHGRKWLIGTTPLPFLINNYFSGV